MQQKTYPATRSMVNAKEMERLADWCAGMQASGMRRELRRVALILTFYFFLILCFVWARLGHILLEIWTLTHPLGLGQPFGHADRPGMKWSRPIKWPKPKNVGLLLILSLSTCELEE